MQIFPEGEAFPALAQTFSSFDQESVETCLVLLDVMAEIYAFFEAHFADHGLSAGKFTILMQLYVAQKDLSPSEFASRANVTRATVTGLLDRLEREHLLERQAHPTDRRMTTVRLTAKGTSLVEAILPDHFARTRQLMLGLDSADQQMLVRLLRIVGTAATTA